MHSSALNKKEFPLMNTAKHASDPGSHLQSLFHFIPNPFNHILFYYYAIYFIG